MTRRRLRSLGSSSAFLPQARSGIGYLALTSPPQRRTGPCVQNSRHCTVEGPGAKRRRSSLCADRLKKDLWTDPSQVRAGRSERYAPPFPPECAAPIRQHTRPRLLQISVCATIIGPLSIVEPIYLGPDGEEVMSQKKNLFFKTTKVRRCAASLSTGKVMATGG